MTDVSKNNFDEAGASGSYIPQRLSSSPSTNAPAAGVSRRSPCSGYRLAGSILTFGYPPAQSRLFSAVGREPLLTWLNLEKSQHDLHISHGRGTVGGRHPTPIRTAKLLRSHVPKPIVCSLCCWDGPFGNRHLHRTLIPLGMSGCRHYPARAGN